MREVAAFVLPVGVHHRERRGQRFAAKVVVKHDDVGGGGSCKGLVAERATIDAEDQIVRGGQFGHSGGVRAVAFVDAVGDVECGVQAHLAQPVDQEGRRRAAVDIVVGEDGDLLVPFDRLKEPSSGGFHVLQAARIGHEVAQLRVKIGGGVGGGHTEARQRLAEGTRQGGVLSHRLGQAVSIESGADPAAPGQGARDSEVAHERSRRIAATERARQNSPCRCETAVAWIGSGSIGDRSGFQPVSAENEKAAQASCASVTS